MKISNETKVGALTAVAITLLILGFNFLKGRSIFKTGTFIYAKYKDTKGIMVSNPVYIKGLQVGSVYELEEANKNLDEIVVAVKLSKDINIPKNSVASISASPLGTTTMDIELGTSKSYLRSGDTVLTTDTPGALADITKRVQPVVDQVKVTLGTMDSVLRNMNSIFDPYTKNNLQSTVAYMNRAMANLVVSSAQLQELLNTRTGALASSLNNVNSFTKNLASNNDKVNSLLTNLQTTSSNFSKADIEGTMAQLQTTVARLNASVEKMDSREGSLGLLLNDKQLYNNIANTTRSVNTLLDDIRVNPKRYLTIGVSLFGGKSKAPPLMAPLPVPNTDTAATVLGTQ